MGARPPPPPTLPNQRESQSCFIVMWSGSSSPPNRICTYMWGHAVSQDLRPPLSSHPGPAPPRPPPAPGPTHVLQRQPQAVTQDPPQVPDLCPHGAPHVLMLQGAEGSARGGCSAGGPNPPPLWDQHRAEPSPLHHRHRAQGGALPAPRSGAIPGHSAAPGRSPAAQPCSCPCWSCGGKRRGNLGAPAGERGCSPHPFPRHSLGQVRRGSCAQPRRRGLPRATRPPAPPSRTRGAGAAAGQACGWAGS